MSFYTSIFKKEISSKKASLMIILSTMVLCGSVLGVNYIIDPYQFYHRSIFDEVYFSKKQRYQIPGIVKNYSADNYLVGTSMSENFSSKEAETIFERGEFRQITISGMKPREFSTIIKYIIKNGRPKTIFIDLHWYFAGESIERKQKQFEFPLYLYSQSRFEHLKYLASHDVFIESMRLFFKDYREDFVSDLDSLNFWMNEEAFVIFNSTENIKRLKQALSLNFKWYYFEENTKNDYKYPNIDKYLEPLFINNPKVDFVLFFPPYSTWHYATIKNRQFGNRLIYMRKYVADRLGSRENVEVHGFDLEFDIVNNLKNYKDYGHYHQKINKFILEKIQERSNLINKENSSDYIRKMINNINNYKIK